MADVGGKQPDFDSKRQSELAERSNRNTVRRDAVLTVVVDMVTSILRADIMQAAAAISYYSLFSLFPLTLFLVVIFTYFADVTDVQEFIYDFLGTIGPGANTIIVENLQSIFEARASTSITAALTLLWSGSGAFSSVIKNVHKAWPESKGRGVLVNRALAIVGIFFTMLLLGGVLTLSILNGLFAWERVFPILEYSFVRWIFSFSLRYLLTFVLLYLVLVLVYRFIPAVPVDRAASRWSAVIAIFVMASFTRLFSAFIFSPFNKYDAVYGSVTVLITFLLYIFVMAYILLCGAHLTAAITHYKQKRDASRSKGKAEPPAVRQSFRQVVKNIISGLFRWK